MCAATTTTTTSAAQVIDEDRLKQISRSIRDFVPHATVHADGHETTARLLSLLDDVVLTAGWPVLSIAHRVAAWNTLCSLIDQSIQSGVEDVRQTVWLRGVWSRALGLYLDHAHHARPKSSRQLLTTLSSALQKQHGQERDQSLQLASNTIVASLVDYEDAPKAKAAMQLLTNFVAKGLLDVKHIPSAFSVQRPGVRIDGGTLCGPDLLEVLLRWLGKGDFGSTIASAIAIVLDQLDRHTSDRPAEIKDADQSRLWRIPLETAFDQGNVSMDDLRAHVFPMLFKRRPADFQAFVHMHGISDGRDPCPFISQASRHTELLYAALQTAKSIGLLTETDGKTVVYKEDIVAFPMSLVGSLLASAERTARLTGLSLLLTSPTPSKPIPVAAFGLLKRALGTYFADVDADFRSEVFGAFQRLVDRIRAVAAVLSRSSDQPSGDTSSIETPKIIMQRHRDLIKWLLRFLAQELRPTASYQRHISALRCLSILARSGLDVSVPPSKWSKSAQGQVKWPFQLDVMDSDLHQLLLNLLMDPFDDVRQSAFLLLGLYSLIRDTERHPASTLGVTPKKYNNARMYQAALDSAEAIMYQTGRADHADGVAYLYSLYYQSCLASQQATSAWQFAEATVLNDRLLPKLTLFVETAQQSLSEAVARYPLHGLLTSLRYVLLQRHEYVETKSEDALPGILYSRLLQIWDLVKPILCDDAPEGYLPEAVEVSTNDTKETLSYCWRALKEGSLLLGALITLDPTDQTSRLAEYSALCFTQLAELRHRGAFSTVAQTWATCCSRARSTTSREHSQLTTWYADVLKMLQNNVTINTRRSAGLPSLLCGILAADSSGSLVAQAVADLENIARQAVDPNSAEEGSLAQVHAMNCLKDVLKNSRLGEQSEPFLANALQLSADSLRSDAWAVRNCGLMLFRAVIDRLLGTSEAHFDDPHIQKRISTEAYPQLLDAVLDLLKAPADGATTRFEGVFPALQLLQLTRIPANRLPETCVAVEALTGSPSWHVRAKAARTLASLNSLSDAALQLDELVSGGSNLHENQIHGALLLAQYTLSQAKSNMMRSPASDEVVAIIFFDCSCLAKTAGQLYYLVNSTAGKAASLDALRACSELVGAINATTREQYDHEALIRTLARVDFADEEAVEVLGAILEANVHDSAAAPVRQAWSRLLAHYLLAQPNISPESLKRVYNMIVELSEHDEDAVVHFLRALKPAQMYSNAPMSEMVLKISSYITESDVGISLKIAAHRTVIEYAGAFDSSLDLTSVLPSKIYMIKNINQEFVDQVLQLQVICAEHNMSSENTHESLLVEHISAWAEACTSAVDGSGIHTREAAADALGKATGLWRLLLTDSRLDTQLLRLCLAVYDLLNDDDEDIRLLASGIVTRILGGSLTRATASEPLIASQRLLAFCIKRWPNSTELAAIALHRAFNLTKESSPPPVADQLAASTSRDTTLFAEEKQNLYIDEAKEVRTWSQVLQKLSISAIERPAVAKLARWLEPGLDSLVSHAQEHPDGAHGWSSHSDVYTVGLQVVYAAELLLNLAQRGAMIPVQPSGLRKQLFTVATALEKSQSSCLWRWELERILTESLSNKISSVSGFIGKGLEKHI